LEGVVLGLNLSQVVLALVLFATRFDEAMFPQDTIDGGGGGLDIEEELETPWATTRDFVTGLDDLAFAIGRQLVRARLGGSGAVT